MVAYNGIDNRTQQLFSTYNVPKDIANAIKSAADKTGVNFTYLVEKAATESGFDTDIKAKTSSATGLYQFIDSTWLSMIKKHGAEHGLGKYSDAITENAHGKLSVTDSVTKQEIMDLRNDAKISALMAAEFADGNKNYLESSVSGEIGNTDLYLAHFMGAGGASKFLNAKSKNGNQVAATLFPDAAKSNRNVFYEPNGKARSLNEVYAFFDKKFQSDNNDTNAVSVADSVKKTNSPMMTINRPSWSPLQSGISNYVKQNEELSNPFAAGGMLAPDTLMFMAALDIMDTNNSSTFGGAGASRWMDSGDDNQKKSLM